MTMIDTEKLSKMKALLEEARECFQQENDGNAVVHDYADDWLHKYEQLLRD